MKFSELKINQQVLYKGNKSSIAHLYPKDKLVVVSIANNEGVVTGLAKVKPQALKPGRRLCILLSQPLSRES